MRSYIITKFNRLHDLRFSSLSAEAERTYDRLYLLAGILDADGLFIENGRALSHNEIAYRIRLQAQVVTKSIKELQKANILHVNGKGPQILDWKHEQIDLNTKREKDRERQHRHRGVTRDNGVTERDSDLSQPVTGIETKTQIKTRVLLLLSKPAQENIQSQHPQWIDAALEIAATKHLDDPEKYAAGILRNWLTEGRKENKPAAKSKSPRANKTGKPDQPKPSDAALKAARERAAKALSK